MSKKLYETHEVGAELKLPEDKELNKKLTNSISTIAGIILLELNIVFGIVYALAITEILRAA